MSHAAPGRFRRRRREVIDERDSNFLDQLAQWNRPTRVARERARQFVRTTVVATFNETKPRWRVAAAWLMTETIRRNAKAGAK